MSGFSNHLWDHRRGYVELIAATATVLALVPAYTDFRIPWSGRGSVALTVDAPDAPVGWCATISGSGKASEGEQIWLIQHTQGRSRYFLKSTKPTPGNPDKWSAYIQIGDKEGAGLQYVFQAVLVTDELAEWMEGVSAPNGLNSDRLPPHSVASSEVAIMRNSTYEPTCN